MVSLSNHVAIPLKQRRRFQRRDCRPRIKYGVAMTSFAIFDRLNRDPEDAGGIVYSNRPVHGSF